MKDRQPWIANAGFDSAFILAPPFLALLGVLLLPVERREGGELGLAGWVMLVLLIDVAHVWSTLFRTYLNPVRFSKHRRLYLLVPVACYAIGVSLYLVGGWLFWRVLAYSAVFHFIRQQFGFLRLYNRSAHQPRAAELLDAVTIYAATLYPIIHWHLEPGRRFNWFIEGDFLQWENSFFLNILGAIYVLIIAAFLAKELSVALKSKRVNLPRNALVLGTALSWYLGIVVWNGDLVFTMLNVISHGIPYMALVWYKTRQEGEQRGTLLRHLLRPYGFFVFAGLIAGIAWLEEGLWDGLVWQGEHEAVFGIFQQLPSFAGSSLLVFLAPLLALPQATHYVLDAFIWKRGHE